LTITSPTEAGPVLGVLIDRIRERFAGVREVRVSLATTTYEGKVSTRYSDQRIAECTAPEMHLAYERVEWAAERRSDPESLIRLVVWERPGSRYWDVVIDWQFADDPRPPVLDDDADWLFSVITEPAVAGSCLWAGCWWDVYVGDQTTPYETRNGIRESAVDLVVRGSYWANILSPTDFEICGGLEAAEDLSTLTIWPTDEQGRWVVQGSRRLSEFGQVEQEAVRQFVQPVLPPPAYETY